MGFVSIAARTVSPTENSDNGKKTLLVDLCVMVRCVCMFSFDDKWLPKCGLLKDCTPSKQPEPEVRRLAVTTTDTAGTTTDTDEFSEGYVSSRQAPTHKAILGALGKNKLSSAFLLLIPFGFVSHFAEWLKWQVFLLNFLALGAISCLASQTIEDLSAGLGGTAGILLQTSFESVVEALVCFAGFWHGQILDVHCVLVGSVLSSMLLSMGIAQLWGAAKHHRQQLSYGPTARRQNLLLQFATLSLLLPTLYSYFTPGSNAIQATSIGCSVLLISMYAQCTAFEVSTRRDHFLEDYDQLDYEEDVYLRPPLAIGMLMCCTTVAAFCSNFLMQAVTGTATSLGVNRHFIGTIILPLANIVVQHKALLLADRNKMEHAFTSSMSASSRTMLYIAPVTVLLGQWFHRSMTLLFDPFQAAVLILSLTTTTSILRDGESNWLEGCVKCNLYVGIALVYLALED